MNTKTSTIKNSSFKKDVFEGLTSFPKYLYSKYIYNERGDKLFQDIMAMPEYYLTDAELDIFETHKAAIANSFRGNGNGFDLIELGAGDGKKTKILLKYFLEAGLDFVYKPIDISEHALENLAHTISVEIPDLKLSPEQGEYFEVLDRLKDFNNRKKVIMFLGSNIGNLMHPRAIKFLSNIKDIMRTGDVLFIGMDQKKEPQQILDAYNDATGITAEFNLNLLRRINEELGANFDLNNFKHWEVYNPESGTAKSYLVSKVDQEITIEGIDLTVKFDAWETIHTEISQKYDDKIVSWLAKEAGFEVETDFSDRHQQYKNYVLKIKE